MDESSLVMVVNHGTTEFTFRWGGRAYPARPARHDQDGIVVPWPAIVNALGNPELVDHLDKNDNPVRDRADELDRLNHRFGMCGASFYTDDETATTLNTEGPRGRDSEIAPYVPIDDGSGYHPAPHVERQFRFRHPNLPRIHAYDLVTRDRIWTVLDDPELSGEQVAEADGAQMMAALTRMEQLERELTEMRNLVLLNASAAPVAAPPTVVADQVGVGTVGGDPIGQPAPAGPVVDEIASLAGQVTPGADLDLANLNPLDPNIAAIFGSPTHGPDAAPPGPVATPPATPTVPPSAGPPPPPAANRPATKAAKKTLTKKGGE